MSRLFNFEAIQPADILHVFTDAALGRSIRRVLSTPEFAVQGSHDALILGEQAGVGESVCWPPFACTTPWMDYEEAIRAGRCKVAILRVPGLSAREKYAITQAWYSTVRGTFYDFGAFPRLWFKAAIKDIWPRAAGWEWAHFCTEGCQMAFRHGTGGALDPWKKRNSTPGTTEHRVASGDILDVSGTCLTAEGQKYRLELKQPAGVKP